MITLKFIVGGTLVAGTAYLSNHIDAMLATILVTIPLELFTLIFLHEDKVKKL
jgi:hypothetical protein